MAGQVQPGLSGAVEGPSVIARAPDQLGPRHAEAAQEPPPGFGGTDRGGPGLFRAEMADAGDDAAQGDAEARLGLVRRAFDRGQVVAPGGQIAAAAEIRRQEGFGIDHAVGRALLQHRQGQAVEILRALQGGAGGLVDLQEMIEIAVSIAAVGGEDARQVDPLFGGQAADEGGWRAAFQVQAQFDLGKVLPAHVTSIPRWSATNAATSTNPIRPSARAPIPWHRTGTRSRVWSVPVQVGSLP